MWWRTEEDLARRIPKLSSGPKCFYWHGHHLVYGRRYINGYVVCVTPDTVTQEEKDAIMNYAIARYAHVVER